jgi:hypothetical protein
MSRQPDKIYKTWAIISSAKEKQNSQGLIWSGGTKGIGQAEHIPTFSLFTFPKSSHPQEKQLFLFAEKIMRGIFSFSLIRFGKDI